MVGLGARLAPARMPAPRSRGPTREARSTAPRQWRDASRASDVRPTRSAVVVIDVAEQQAAFGAVHDQPDVGAHADGPEALVLGLIELVKAQTRALIGSIWRSNAVVLTAFCSSPVRRARLSVKLSAIRKFIDSLDVQPLMSLSAPPSNRTRAHCVCGAH